MCICVCVCVSVSVLISVCICCIYVCVSVCLSARLHEHVPGLKQNLIIIWVILGRGLLRCYVADTMNFSVEVQMFSIHYSLCLLRYELSKPLPSHSPM